MLFIGCAVAVVVLVAGLILAVSNMTGQDGSADVAAPAPSVTAGSHSAASEDEIGEAPEQIIRPMYERIVRGGLNCEPFTAMYVSPDQTYRRIESGACGSAAEISIIFAAYRNATDRAAEVVWLAKSSRESGFAPLIVYGDDWAVMCQDGAVLSAVQRILGGTIVT
ncbi:hypothetical protein [Streptosporangium roseum]|uniref:hypothetical protein n=1 Tax=Streptosporangium roseum TaxID=2001 RepID=UPI00331CC7A7